MSKTEAADQGIQLRDPNLAVVIGPVIVFPISRVPLGPILNKVQGVCLHAKISNIYLVSSTWCHVRHGHIK